MPRRTAQVRLPLTPDQLNLLRRIADGTDPLTTADSRLAVSVYALRSRWLVSTTSARHYWSASLTTKAELFLDESTGRNRRTPSLRAQTDRTLAQGMR